MFQAYESAFENKSVLRAQALNESLNGARKTIEQMYSGYSDGILRDIVIEQESNSIVIKGGVLLFQGRIYYLDKEIRISIQPNNRKEFLKIRFLEVQHKDGLKKWTTDVVLDENEMIRNDEMELCRFQYQPGAKLRNTYSDFRDYSVEYNIINILYAPYAAPGESTIASQITQRFGEELLKRKLTDPYDIAFCFECQRGSAVSRKSILAYIYHKLDMDERNPNHNLNHNEIYTYLNRILERNDNEPVERPAMRGPRLIMI